MAGESSGVQSASFWSPTDSVRSGLDWDHAPFTGQEENITGRRLRECWRIAWNYKFLILAFVAVSLTCGFVLTLLTPRVYTASATLEIDRQTSDLVGGGDVPQLDPSGQDALDLGAQDEEFFKTQYGLLKSRSLAVAVATSENLADDPAFLHAMHINAGKNRKASLALIAGILTSGLGVSPIPDSRLVVITFDSPDPGLSARIVNAFADNFIRSNLQRRFNASAYARNFLEQRLAELKAKLEESERELVGYAAQQQIIHVSQPVGANKQESSPESLDATNLSYANEALSAAETNMLMAQRRWRGTQVAPGLAAPDILGDPAVQQLRQKRATLQARYEELGEIFKPDYPEMQQVKAQIADIDAQLEVAADTVRRSLKVQAETAADQTAALADRVTQLKTSVLDERNREIQYNILQREVDSTRTLYEGLLQRYKEIGVLGGVTTNNVSIVDSATPPGGPSRPDPKHNFTMAAMLGLGLGLGLAYLLDALDRAISTPVDVEAKLGLPVLGCVPLLERTVHPLGALADLRSPFSEAHHAIRTNLAFASNAGLPKVLALTSTLPEEGKSTTALALAQGFARIRMRVLLVELDLRNPSQHRTICARNGVGISTVLTGDARLCDAIQETSWPNLFLIPSGPLPASPAELLEGTRFPALVKEAADLFDIVILDGPPVMGLADALLVASAATGTILTVEAGRTDRTQARAAIKRLRRANARLCGAVLTKFDASKTSYDGYDYSYEYAYQGEGQLRRMNTSAELAPSRRAERRVAPVE